MKKAEMIERATKWLTGFREKQAARPATPGVPAPNEVDWLEFMGCSRRWAAKFIRDFDAKEIPVTATKITEPPDEIEWHNVTVIEAHVRGKTYRIEEPWGCGGEVNVYCNSEFIGLTSGVESAKDAIARGLC